MTPLAIDSSSVFEPPELAAASKPAETPTTTDLEPEPETSANAALKRCIKAFDRTYNLASIHPEDESLDPQDGLDEDETFAREQGAIAFREALPMLAGYENIRDFIACVTYGMLMNILPEEEFHELLVAARTAVALLRTQPRE